MGRTASRARTTTSSPNRVIGPRGPAGFTRARHCEGAKPPKQPGRAGFTLIEILLVIGIISMVMSLGLPAISRVTGQRVNSTARKFIGVIRTIRNDAILLNAVHRLVVDFEKRTWWVESQNRFQLLEDPETAAPKDKKKKGEEAPPSDFSFAEKFSKEPVPLPGGVEISGILKEKEGLQNEGTAYVHFFPNGFNEQAILYIGREGNPESSYSLLVRPTSGKVELFREMVRDFN